MPSGMGQRFDRLTVLDGAAAPGRRPDGSTNPAGPPNEVAELDWSILMARAQTGDREAYRRLLVEITPYLRRLAQRRRLDAHDAEDAVQDVLMALHAVRHTYDPSRPFAPWLFTVAERRIIDRVRIRLRARAREEPLADRHETFSAPDANTVERLSDRRALQQALDELPPTQRRAMQMLKLEEMSLKEASAASGMSIAALKVASHRATRNLRNLLSRRGEGR